MFCCIDCNVHNRVYNRVHGSQCCNMHERFETNAAINVPQCRAVCRLEMSCWRTSSTDTHTHTRGDTWTWWYSERLGIMLMFDGTRCHPVWSRKAHEFGTSFWNHPFDYPFPVRHTLGDTAPNKSGTGFEVSLINVQNSTEMAIEFVNECERA